MTTWTKEHNGPGMYAIVPKRQQDWTKPQVCTATWDGTRIPSPGTLDNEVRARFFDCLHGRFFSEDEISHYCLLLPFPEFRPEDFLGE